MVLFVGGVGVCGSRFVLFGQRWRGLSRAAGLCVGVVVAGTLRARWGVWAQPCILAAWGVAAGCHRLGLGWCSGSLPGRGRRRFARCCCAYGPVLVHHISVPV